ncbi:Gamma-secretase subunit Aph-1 [Pseudolycoriella hygida]|uniref:Gamma-secretase subunit Aph-1 n=1 Tax=Pseudolycoriella hygida TaxID=35572 RepID=A0A9Q0S5Y0_9DIPT|nr:Gamma-secretase subunit Aph-1 [Pseudolycoriella hygida]
MTLPEFFGCTFLAFGPPLAMFIFTIAHDPIRIIILIAAAFVWLLSLLLSSLMWFAIVPLRDFTAFGLVFSVIFQESFRFLIYKILRKTEKGLQEVANSPQIIANKHILAYVSGLGFGIISGLFALMNILADAAGPATFGLKIGSPTFLLTSSTQTLLMILLHTFWSVIFFDSVDNSKHAKTAYVVVSHLFVSVMTLLNTSEMYTLTIGSSVVVTIITGIMAFITAGGSFVTFKRFATCK